MLNHLIDLSILKDTQPGFSFQSVGASELVISQVGNAKEKSVSQSDREVGVLYQILDRNVEL